MTDLSSLFANKNLWERLQALHCLMIQLGCAADKLHIHPDSVEKLSIEMAPKPARGEVFEPSKIVGGVSAGGPFAIIEDVNGVVL